MRTRLSPVQIGELRNCWVMDGLSACRVIDAVTVPIHGNPYTLYVVERVTDGRRFKISRVKIGKVIK